jgi:hypothetical protein
MRLRPVALVLPLLLAGCADVALPGWAGGSAAAPPAQPIAATAAAPPPTRAEALVAGRRCGVTLGLAARCNLVRDDRDFAVLRFAVLEGLDRRYGGVVPAREMAETVDLATLDRMTSIGSCTVPEADAERLATGVRGALATCTGR